MSGNYGLPVNPGHADKAPFVRLDFAPSAALRETRGKAAVVFPCPARLLGVTGMKARQECASNSGQEDTGHEQAEVNPLSPGALTAVGLGRGAEGFGVDGHLSLSPEHAPSNSCLVIFFPSMCVTANPPHVLHARPVGPFESHSFPSGQDGHGLNFKALICLPPLVYAQSRSAVDSRRGYV